MFFYAVEIFSCRDDANGRFGPLLGDPVVGFRRQFFMDAIAMCRRSGHQDVASTRAYRAVRNRENCATSVCQRSGGDWYEFNGRWVLDYLLYWVHICRVYCSNSAGGYLSGLFENINEQRVGRVSFIYYRGDCFLYGGNALL